MNRFFDRNEYRRDFPARAFTRLDDLEPIVAGPDDDLEFIFDAVDADWPGFGTNGLFDLAASDLETTMRARWESASRGTGFQGPDGYDEVPVYRIEFSLQRGHPWFAAVPQNEESWVTFVLSKQTSDVPVNVYGGLFAPPIQAFLHAAPTLAPAAPLSTIFDMGTWPDATSAALLSALTPQCNLEALVCFDIGQGSASALVCQCGYPIYYYDTGCGSGRNAKTAPSLIDFCTCKTPPVIMSHWDTDHWAGASNGFVRAVWHTGGRAASRGGWLANPGQSRPVRSAASIALRRSSASS